MNLLMYIIENLFYSLHRRSMVVIYNIVNEIDKISFLLEFRRDDLVGFFGDDAEGNQCWGYIHFLKGTAHGVLATDGRQVESILHVYRT